MTEIHIKMKFIDKTKIRVVSGRGGNGMVAWRREKYVDKGGPAGGDGGRGGDVYLIADENMSTLMDFKHKSVFKAEAGENGGIKNMHGACAKDLYIKVPVGTVVKDMKTGNVIADLTYHEQKVLVAKAAAEDVEMHVSQLPRKELPSFVNRVSLQLKENCCLN